MDGNVMAGKTLTIVLAADISRLSKGLRSAQGDLDTFDGRINSLGNKISGSLGPAAIGAAAAVGTLAVAMAVQGVQGALADEAAVAKLTKTLDNLGLASDTAQIETFIDALSRSAGVADDQLRPAYDRLIRSTQDVGLANSGLALSLDIAQGTGKSLESVTNALGKAYDGSTTSLGKLGTGLDKATLATGDMELITAELAKTFGGQAATQAETFQGKLARLSVGFDELKEAFGYGFLDAFDTATGGMDDFMLTLKDLEPQLKTIGTAMGNLTIATAGLGIQGVKNLSAFLVLLQNPTWGTFGTTLANLGKSLADWSALLPGYLKPVGTALGFLGTTLANTQPQDDASASYGRTAAELARFNVSAGLATVNWDALTPAVVTNTTATTAASAAQKVANDQLDNQNKILDASKSKLSTQTDALKAAGQAYVDYWQNLQGKITSGIDLGEAFAKSLETGQPLTEAFGAQIAQGDWYGTILRELKASNASQGLIDAVTAQGPEAGAKLGETIILEGLIPTLNAQLDYVKASSELTAKAMVPAFLIEGQNAAIGFVQEAATQVLKDQEKLVKIGKNIGKPIALQAAAEIATVLAKTFKDIEAAKTAADAAAAAAAASRRVLVSDQQAIQQLNQILANGNARAGYQDTVVLA